MRDGSFGPQLCFGGGELPAFPMRDGSFGSLLFLWRREAPCIEPGQKEGFSVPKRDKINTVPSQFRHNF